MKLGVVQLCDLLIEFGEDEVAKFLAEFSCSVNKDVEKFLHKKAILYDNVNKGRTYLIVGYDDEKLRLIAYFTLTTRPIDLDDSLSKKRKKEILGTGYEANKEISGNLIGQIGKNFTNNYNLLLTGKDLFDIALHKVLQANKLIGGRILYLECEDREKLHSFYKSVELELYVDNNDNPIVNEHGLLTYMKASSNIIVDKKKIRERIERIIVNG